MKDIRIDTLVMGFIAIIGIIYRGRNKE